MYANALIWCCVRAASVAHICMFAGPANGGSGVGDFKIHDKKLFGDFAANVNIVNISIGMESWNMNNA